MNSRTWALLLAITATLVVVALRRPPLVQKPSYDFSRRFASNDGVLVAHFPEGFVGASQPAEGATGLTISRIGGNTAVGLGVAPIALSVNPEDFYRVVIEVQRRNWEKDGIAWLETSHHDETCLGSPGVASEGLLKTKTETLRGWNCVTVRNGAGIYVNYAIGSGVDVEEDRLARLIIDATELHLEPYGPKR